MKKTIYSLAVLISGMAMTHAEETKDAMYFTDPDSGKQVAVCNLDVCPVLQNGDDIAIVVNNDTVKTIPFKDGLKITFGKSIDDLRGDANSDGMVTIYDAKIVTNKVLGKLYVTVNEENADVNADGKLSFSDANAIVNIALDK